MRARDLNPLRPGISIQRGDEMTQFIARKSKEIDENRARLNELLAIMQAHEECHPEEPS